MSADEKVEKLEALLARLVKALQVEASGLSGSWGHPFLGDVLTEIAADLPAPPQSSESNARIVAGPEKVE